MLAIGRYEPGFPALRSDRLDRLGAALTVAAVDDDLGARVGEPQGDRFAETRRCSRNERLQALQIAVFGLRHDYTSSSFYSA